MHKKDLYLSGKGLFCILNRKIERVKTLLKKSLQQLIEENKENIMRDKAQLKRIERNLEQKHTDSQKGDA
ncbi:FbpB family small basic protein [Rossellomorea aquimaris]|uniref:FbpB family small basic protein n=1 Tax=Rossellomorea aquimaris TaxID=189382 RepID=A0A1J6WVU3_9BACI|nr:hypothetical protein BHE18_04855 [Rossellomorea aquimaris]